MILSPEDLPPRDEERAKEGAKALVKLHPRVVICLIFWIVATRPTLSEVLEKLDYLRIPGIPKLLRGVGGDRFPRSPLHEVS